MEIILAQEVVNLNMERQQATHREANISNEKQRQLDLALSINNQEDKNLKTKANQEASEKRRVARLEKIKINNDAISSFEDQAIAARQRSKDIMVSVLPMGEQIAIRAKEQADAIDGQIATLESRLLLMQETAKTEEELLQLEFAQEQAVETIAALKEQQSLTEQEALIQIDELKDSLHSKDLDRVDDGSEKRLQAIRDEATAIGQMGDLTMGIFKNTVSTIGTLSKAAGIENAHLVRSLFEMQRVAAIGEIAFNVAKNITLAGAYLPPLNGLMIASAIAAGAAQTATVLSQSPPQLHMGGMTPDESIAVVKSGEAVLDRTTVNNLGGQQGINRLQNGQGGSAEVIVMNPYKHFDRFMTDRQRAGISSRSARRGY